MASSSPKQRRSSSGSKRKHRDSSAKKEKKIVAPAIPERSATLTLPERWTSDPDRYEFWSIRVPQNISLDQMARQLQDQPLILPENANSSSNNGKGRLAHIPGASTVEQPVFEIKSDTPAKDPNITTTTKTTPYTLQFGHSAENEGLSLLVPKSWVHPHDAENDDNSNNHSDDDEQQEPYVPLPYMRFTHHLQVVQHHEVRGELSLAPHPDNAPVAPQLRPAYTSVPQKTGLRRRWHPLGCTDKTTTLQDQQHQQQSSSYATAASTSSTNRKRSSSEDEKRARKSAKKARKESKRAKKERKRTM